MIEMASESMLVDFSPATEETPDRNRQQQQQQQQEVEEAEEGSERKKKESETKPDHESSSKRPARERKLVERYSIPFPPLGKPPPNKPLAIPKGSGSQLKDIPNVAFKLSKRKIDENLQLLHTILFGKKAKPHSLKKNISQFSGFVWTENEEKQRSKVKDKLDKCTKEKLVDFCDVLNIPINKATVKKEELSAKLLVFLESPCATTDVLLSEKDQKGQKHKRKHTPSKSPSSGEATETPAKKQKQTAKDGKKQLQSTYADNDENMAAHPDIQDNSGDDGNNEMVSMEESDHAGDRSLEEKDSPKDKVSKDHSGEKEKKVIAKNNGDEKKAVKKAASEKPAKSSSKSSKKSSKKGAADADGSLGTPVKLEGSSSTKKAKKETKKEEGVTTNVRAKKETKKEEGVTTNVKAKKETKKEGVTTNVKAKGKKQSYKSPEKLDVKDQGKSKTGKKAKAEPTRKEMHAVVVDILKKVDFNTATLSDIIKLLGAHFGMELLHRKGEVKEIITDVINNMSDDEEEEEEDADENTGTDDFGENDE